MNPYDGPQSPPPGMSSGVKVLLGLGIGCGVLVLLCCGGGVVTMYFFGRSLERAMSQDPETIRRVTASIVSIDVPESLEPQMSFDYAIPFAGGNVIMVLYGSEEESGLALIQVDEKLGNRNVIEAQFKDAMQQSGRGDWDEVELEDSETLKQEINGSEAEFRVGHGKRDNSGQEVWQATGAFQGKGGPAMLFLQLDAKDFTKDDAMAIVKSMK